MMRLALVALVALAALLGADALPTRLAGFAKKLKKHFSSEPKAFEPIGAQWTPKQLKAFAKRLGGEAVFTPAAKLQHFTNPDEVSRRFEAKGSLAAAKVQASDKVSFRTFDAEGSTRVTVPVAALNKFAEGVSTAASDAGSEPEHEHVGDVVQTQHEPLALLETGAGKVFGEKPDWRKITGATEMAKAPMNNVVQLIYLTPDKKYYYFCSGAVVSKNLVLTAVHCVADIDGYNAPMYTKDLDLKNGKLEVLWKRDGANQFTDFSTKRGVKKISLFEGFDYTQFSKTGGDFAVLHLDAAAPAGSFGYAAGRTDSERLADMTPAALKKDGGKAYVHVTGYPNEAKGGENIWCDRCLLPTFKKGDVTAFSKCDSEHGSSGGPVWYKSEKLGSAIIGVVSTQKKDKTANIMAMLTPAATRFLSAARKLVGDA